MPMRSVMTLCFFLGCFSAYSFGSSLESSVESSAYFDRLAIADGLSQNSVRNIVEDRQGFMWFATEDGLNRYDGYTFKVFSHDPANPGSLSNNDISRLYLDTKGRLWIGTYKGGLNRFDAETERFVVFKHDESNPHSLSDNEVASIFQDSRGTLWVGTIYGGLNLLDESSGQFKHFSHDSDDPYSLSNNTIYAMSEDANGDLWFGTRGGLNHFDIRQQRFSHYKHSPSNPHSLNDDIVYALLRDSKDGLWLGTSEGLNYFDGKVFTSINYQDELSSLSKGSVVGLYEDADGMLWVASNSGGLHRYDPLKQSFVHFTHNKTDPHSLSTNSVRTIYQDSRGLIWIGTYGGGLNQFDSQKQRFGHVKHQPDNPTSLSHNLVWSFLEDSSGTLWVGTDEGLTQYSDKVSGFVDFKHQSPNNLNRGPVSGIQQDDAGNLWFGADGLFRYNPETGDLDHFKHQPSDLDSLSSDVISMLYIDKKGLLWIGTDGGGLNRFNSQQQNFTRYQHSPADPDSLSDNSISTVFEDSQGLLWVGTSDGLNRFDGQGFVTFKHQAGNEQSLSNSNIFVITQDKNGMLWVGTSGGLNKFDPRLQGFSHYSVQDGLANNVVYGIVEGDQGQLWLSTNKGLSMFDPITELFTNFDVNDGLQSNEFSEVAYYKSASGEVFFGGINGFNHFYPENIIDDTQLPEVVLTDFLLNNQTVPVRSMKESADNTTKSPSFTLPKSINELQSLTLGHQHKLISFEFAALHFNNPLKNQYAYQLQGQDPDWIYTSAKKRWATYTNLPAGDYTLRIKASNSGGYWNEQGKSLKITILPPWWQTRWAYGFYVLVLLGVILAFVAAHRKQVRYERSVVLKLKQMDKLKDEFMANTSHELRTPLNGIIGLAESLMDGAAGQLPNKANDNLAMVAASGKRLANLINDILDFSKLKDHKLTLQMQSVDLYSLTEVVLTLSRPLLSNKALHLVNDVPKSFAFVEVDENRLLQVLHNLVGNAIKYTDVGHVTVSVTGSDEGLTLSVSDTGIGIEADRLDSIFDAFEQLEGHTERIHSGTGLGLSLSQQLIELHGSRIEVVSTPGEGSCFSFLLPKASCIPVTSKASSQTVSRLHDFGVTEPVTNIVTDIITDIVNSDTKPWRILLVDDEPVNRQVLYNHLSQQNYQLVEASNGSQALQIIKQGEPFDLVLLDIMMPRMSGYEMCRTLRKTHSFNNLPVIFLTAKNQVTDMVQSFNVGANDYLSKPINKHELLVRVQNQLKLLDIHRDLEAQVLERTVALIQKVQQLESKKTGSPK